MIDSKNLLFEGLSGNELSKGRAFNYFPQNYFPPQPDFSVDTSKLWDTDNVSGLEKKLCHLGGIE
jgi:hypothetical protein